MTWHPDSRKIISVTKGGERKVKQLSIHYHTINVYDGLVKEALFDLLVLPCNDMHQRLTQHRIQTSVPSSVSGYRNSFGFEVVRVKTLEPFHNFELNMYAAAEVNHSIGHFPTLGVAAQHELLNSHDFFIDNHLYLTPSPLTTIDFVQWALCPRIARTEPVESFLERLNNEVNQLLAYKPYFTSVDTSAGEALAMGIGVCQDYSHIFLSIARENRIPCRYVSGYIDQGHQFLGDMQMHAWVEAYIPGAGWKGFDPTNNILVDENFVKVAHGLDYNDCSPLRGVLMAQGSSNSTVHTVKVTHIK
jgi:hypothetical protein